MGHVYRVRQQRPGDSQRQSVGGAAAWGINHPILDGLGAQGLLDDRIFARLLPLTGFVDVDAGGQIICAAHLCRIHPDEYRSGVLLSVHDHGAGSIVLNALQILENLGVDPAADRLLPNLLRFAAAERG